MKDRPFSIKARFKSFTFAFSGLLFLIRSEHNAWIHGIATITVIVLSFLFKLSTYEWLFVLIAIGMVWTAEAFNTALEKLCDKVQGTHDGEIKVVKDLSAGAVLMAAICSLIIGLVIFLPKII